MTLAEWFARALLQATPKSTGWHANISPVNLRFMTMPNIPSEQSLDEAETEFLHAFRVNDIDCLDTILHSDVEFVGPEGSIIDKDADMASHRAGDLELESVEELSRRVQVIEGIGITRVKLHIKASVGESPVDAVLMYSRTWLHQDNRWTIVAAHGSILPT